MYNTDKYSDNYDYYSELFDPIETDRRSRRNTYHKPKKSAQTVIAELAELTEMEGGFETTYHPARYEKEWLYRSLGDFYSQALITDVLEKVKGGKEASVYMCQADPRTGFDLVAAKVYRPRQFRNLRNDAMYRQGRQVITEEGKSIQERDHRLKQAMIKGTSYGMQLRHTSWLMYEYTTMQRLYQANAAVPQPLASAENAILMTYLGDTHQAAPTLNQVDLLPHQAQPLFDEILRNVELMLQHTLVHGDLSAYNILYWQSAITLIDFPQVVDALNNPDAYRIFQRDITRICQYFEPYGVPCNAETIATALWNQYVGFTTIEADAEIE